MKIIWTILFMLVLAMPAMALTQQDMIDAANAVGEKAATVTPAQVLQVFPNAARVDGVGVYLFRAKAFGIGPSFTVAKVWNLINADVQFAALTKGGSYIGPAISADIVDLIAKTGITAPNYVVKFHPSIGVTGGYVKSFTDNMKSGWDGGIRVNVLNVDMAKVASMLGL